MSIPTKSILIALTLISLFSTDLTGQKISLKGVNLELSLQDYRLEDIIDGTPDEDHIGYIYKGLVSSTLKQVYFDDSVTEEFERLFRPVFSQSADAIPIVIRINSIQVMEWAEAFAKKTNLVSLGLSIFQQTEDDKYVLIADRIINDINNNGVRLDHIPDRIGHTVDRAFDYLELNIDYNRPGLTWTDLWEYQPYQGLPYPRLKDKLQVFEHYSDFRENKSFEDLTLHITEGQKGPVLLNDTNTHPEHIWGYSFKGNLFINMGKQFEMLQPIDNGYATRQFSDRRETVDGLNSLVPLTFLARTIALGASNQNDAIVLSNETGYLNIKSIYDNLEPKDRTALGNKTIIEFAPFGSPGDIVDIKIDGNVLIQLSKGEFFQLPSNLETTEIQACIDKSCTTVTLDDTPLHRIIFKKGKITQEPFTEKEKVRYLRNVDLKYWVLF